MIPLRATGTHVLLRRVKTDTRVLWFEDKTPGVLQVGEVVSLGPRWTADRQWRPPVPGSVEKPKGMVFTPTHAARLEDVQPGDLVVYNQARVLDHFRWEHDDILVYPGNWLLGVYETACLPAHPHRRYERHAV